MKNLKFVKLIHCSKQSLIGSQFIYQICFALCRPYYSRLNKSVYICSGVFVVLTLGFCLCYVKQVDSKRSWIIALKISLRRFWDRNTFIRYKNLSQVFDIGFPDRFSSSTRPRYLTVWYCSICTVTYLTSRLLSFVTLFFGPSSILLVLSPLMNVKFVIAKPIANQS